MKKFFGALLAATAVFLTGCFDTTDEITIKDDGSGVYTTTNDLSAVVGVAKQMGGQDADKMNDMNVDTTISLSTKVDSIESLTADEKALMKKGIMHMKVNMKDEKVVIAMTFPFSNTAEIMKLNQLSTKLMGEAMKSQMGGDDNNPIAQMPEQSSFDSYFNTTYSNGVITKTLNKAKYANVAADEYLKGMKEAGSMGIPVSTTQVINLPRPAKKAEGKNVKLSDDKKKVTIKASIDDFFDEPAKLEYRIEY